MSHAFEQRKRAVELYVKYDKSVAAVRRELGCPSRQALHDWHADCVGHGFRPDCRPHEKFTAGQRQAAALRCRRPPESASAHRSAQIDHIDLFT